MRVVDGGEIVLAPMENPKVTIERGMLMRATAIVRTNSNGSSSRMPCSGRHGLDCAG